MSILEVIIAPYGTYYDGHGGYWLNGNNIALNAESYKVEDPKLLNVFSLEINSNIDNLENEKLTNNLGETFETMEEYLQLTYGLENLEPNDYIIISFENQ